MNSGKKVVVCFDGLNQEQFLTIVADMPILAELLGTGAIAELDTTPFVDPQPIWAEILTGEPWYRNGCAGYARPLRTLNKLEVNTERTLQMPIRLADSANDGLDIFINAPLVEPQEGHRLWLSDGGTTSMTTVSPSSLATQVPFKNYVPRAFVSMGEAMSNVKESIAAFIDGELQRLECAAVMTKNDDWKFFLYRTSIFDQLSHVLGPSFLKQQNLIARPNLKRLLNGLDNVLIPLLMQAEQRLLLSAFSHVACKGIFSLNTALEKSKLLCRTAPLEAATDLRLLALAAAQKSDEGAVRPVTINRQMQYFARKTLCASPVRGTIYLNSANRFDDGGEIDQVGIAKEEARIREFFEATTKPLYKSVSLVHNPEIERGGPNYVFHIDGIELVETQETTERILDLPLSTHTPTGFIWSPKVARDHKYRSVDVVNVI